MFAKIKNGCTPAGLVDYANNEIEKDAKLIASEGVITTNNKAMAASFALQSKSNHKTKNYVGHIVLAFSPKDKARMSDELMLEVAKEYMRRMGIVDTQYAIFRHFDKDHDHLHIIYNRVNNLGKELKNDKNFRASIAITQVLTREYGLTFGEGKEKVNRDRLKGKDKIKYRFYDDIKPILERATSWDMFKTLLDEKGYEFLFHHIDEDETQEIKGISFSDGKMKFSGRQLDKTMTYFAIDNRIKFNAALEAAKSVSQDKSESSQSGAMSQGSSLFDNSSSSSDSGGQSATFEESASEDMEQMQTESFVQSESDASASGPDVVGAIGGTIATAIDIATTIQPSVGGGGGSSSKLDDDDDDKKKRRGRGRH